MTRSRLYLLAIGAALIASACRDVPLTGPDTGDPNAALVPFAAFQGGLSVVSRLDQAVPGFGGFFLDELDRPTVFLAAGVDRGAAMRILREELRRLGIQGEIQVRPASYLWRDLVRWHDAASPVALAIDGVYWTDADESGNVVRIGVGDLTAMARVRAEAAQLGIPAGALQVDPSPPIDRLATLRDEVRPVVGGIQIHFLNFLCTLGFNAVGGGEASFITASHCTENQGGVDDTRYYQPLSSVNSTQIAQEVSDPVYTGGGDCPANMVCRQSDAARARYINSTASSLGKIARTESFRGRRLEIVGDWTITAADDATTEFVLGTVLNKTGRTTGWSQGRVVGTCINSGIRGTNIVLFCQSVVQMRSNSGDSGAPIFEITGGTNVKLVGLMWGGFGQFTFWSPLKNIEDDLGNLTVF